MKQQHQWSKKLLQLIMRYVIWRCWNEQHPHFSTVVALSYYFSHGRTITIITGFVHRQCCHSRHWWLSPSAHGPDDSSGATFGTHAKGTGDMHMVSRLYAIACGASALQVSWKFSHTGSRYDPIEDLPPAFQSLQSMHWPSLHLGHPAEKTPREETGEMRCNAG